MVAKNAVWVRRGDVRMRDNSVKRSQKGASFALAMVGIAIAAIAIVGLILYMASSQTKDSYADRSDEAVAVAKASKVGTDTLDARTKQVIEKRKQEGVEVRGVGWRATQREGAEYYVTFFWEEGSLRERKSATWKVNIKTKQVAPYNSEAKRVVGAG